MNRYVSLKKNNNKPTNMANYHLHWTVGSRHEIQFYTKQNKPTVRLVMSKHAMFLVPGTQWVSALNTARDSRSRCSPKAIPLSPGPGRKFNRSKHYPAGPHFNGCRQHAVHNHTQPGISQREARKVNKTSADRKRADDLRDGSFF